MDAASIDRAACLARDLADPLAACRSAFALPPDLIYLDGNSLGPLPHAAAARIARTVTHDWGHGLIRSWNDAGWIDLPERVGDRIAALIGAAPGSVTAGDSTSINLFKALNAALGLPGPAGGRRTILSDTGNFPTDLYVAQGVCAASGGRLRLRTVPPDGLAAAVDGDTAIVMATHVDFRTGRMHDMRGVTEAAHAAGAVMVWDLAHSAGAVPLDLAGSGAEFAVGCGYKYLNGGPGAPGFIHVRPDLQDRVTPALCGWMGHAAPFDFAPGFAPAAGARRQQVGTPPILSLAALDAALEVWQEVDMAAVRQKSLALGDLFIALVERDCAGLGLTLATPRSHEARGSQVSFTAGPELAGGYPVMQALIADGVIGDFRAPDLLRFGFTPLYLRHVDVFDAAARLHRILAQRRWDRPQFHARAAVT
ncbi:MAG: kynureninase [Sneathiellaceae bacterium]